MKPLSSMKPAKLPDGYDDAYVVKSILNEGSLEDVLAAAVKVYGFCQPELGMYRVLRNLPAPPTLDKNLFRTEANSSRAKYRAPENQRAVRQYGVEMAIYASLPEPAIHLQGNEQEGLIYEQREERTPRLFSSYLLAKVEMAWIVAGLSAATSPSAMTAKR